MTPDTGNDMRRVRDAEIFARLGNIESGMAALNARLEERCDVRQRTLDDHDTRLRHLEESAHKRKGGIGVLLGMLTIAASAGAAAAKMLWG